MLAHLAICSQPVYEHVSHKGIYEFLDEMANMGVIELNSLMKPYTRSFINEKLAAADSSRKVLNKRQSEMLDFYLIAFDVAMQENRRITDFRKGAFHYHDSVFTIQLRPILGVSFLTGYPSVNADVQNYHRYNGAEIWASVKENWGFYASLRDNYSSGMKVSPEHLVDVTGGAYKVAADSSVEYSEMRCGVVYGNRWLTLGLVKDHLEWGNNYYGANIFTPHTPSFVQIKMQIRPAKWFEFNYFHAWLNSDMIDSVRTYSYTNAYGTRNRHVYREKYMAANMITFKPWKQTHISLGNSIIYADMGVHPAYLIPVAFYKSIDHTLNAASNRAGQNAQLFFDVSTRRIRKTHLYATLFIDEIATTRMFDPERQSNYISIKTGIRVSNFPLENVHVTGEYIRTNPLVYQHFTPSTTYESNSYNLGHYLRDNAEQHYFSLIYEPVRRVRVEVAYNSARKGPDYNSIGGSRHGLPFINEERFSRKEYRLKCSYQMAYNIYGHITYQYATNTGEDYYMYLPDGLDYEKMHLVVLQICFGL